LSQPQDDLREGVGLRLGHANAGEREALCETLDLHRVLVEADMLHASTRARFFEMSVPGARGEGFSHPVVFADESSQNDVF
jgi:hypothetical protein